MPSVVGQALQRVGAFLKPVERANRAFLRSVSRWVWRNRPLQERLDPATVRRVLFLRHDVLGDMLTTMPMFRLLKQLNPQIQIHVVASPSNRVLIEHDPNVDAVILMPRGFWPMVKAIRTARRNRYDVVLACIFGKGTNTGMLANLMGGRSAIKATVNRDPRYHAYFNVQSDRAAQIRSMWEKMLMLVADTFNIPDSVEAIQPYVAIPEASALAAQQRLAELGLQGERILAVNLSTARERNRWPIERFHELLREVLVRYPTLRLLLLTTPNDTKSADQLQQLLHDTRVSAYPRTNDVMEVIAVIKQSWMAFTPDTGIIHMASAVGTPVAGLYVGGRGAAEWRPFGVPYRVIASVDSLPVGTIPTKRALEGLEELMVEVEEGNQPTQPLAMKQKETRAESFDG
ncbi:MAG: lipopolysaccharide heptosyltransferase family protein [Chlorobi bacterium CHB2]|nr:lipopolysaccharide heptosyltransferase family protein [Chlorobi bacterium CHB2]